MDNVTCSHLHLNVTYSIESTILFIVSSTSLILHIIFMKILTKCQGQLPLNTKLLMVHCTVASGLKSLCLIVKSMYNFGIFSTANITLIIDRPVCIGIELPYGVSMNALVLSMLSIGIERLWATFKKNNITQHESVGWGIVIAQASIWLISLFMFAGFMTIDEAKMAKSTCYCFYMMLSAPTASTISRSFFITSLILIVLINMLVHWKNKRLLFDSTLNTARHNLSSRFVMWSNVKATRMLLPSSIVHAVSYFTIVVMISLQKESLRQGLANEGLMGMLATQCVLALDSMIHPLLCLLCSTELKKIFVQIFPGAAVLFKSNSVMDGQKNVDGSSKCTRPTFTGASVVVQYHLNPDRHQDILQQMWNKDAKRLHTTKPSNHKK